MTEFIVRTESDATEMSELEQYRDSGRDLVPHDLSNPQVLRFAYEEEGKDVAQMTREMNQAMPEGYRVDRQTVGLTLEWHGIIQPSSPGGHIRQHASQPPFRPIIAIVNRQGGSDE